MNCQTFESLVTDLARDGLVGETLRPEALAHAGFCDRCGARLAQESSLTAALKFAAADQAEAPTGIEDALLSAYRFRHGRRRRRSFPWRFLRSVPMGHRAVAATLVLLILGATAFRLLRSGFVDRRSAAVAPLAELASPANEPGASAAGDADPAEGDGRNNPLRVGIATDFIALTSSAEIRSMESGQLVRVLLPRSALASFGLPVNQELSGTPVPAQVLISQDGVAHAIRFLSDAEGGSVPARVPARGNR